MRMQGFLRRLSDQPFRPFRVHLSDGKTIDVEEPGMLIVGESSAVLPNRFGRDPEGRRYAEDWRTIALSHVVQFSDLSEPIDGKHRRKK